MKTTIHDDNRGSHTKFFTRASADAYGFNDVTEVFMTTNRKGTLRGLHRQFGEGVTQQKIVKPISGKFNVKVIFPLNELTEETFRQNLTEVVEQIDLWPDYVVLNFYNQDINSNPIAVPAGAYLGYVSLEDDSRMLYIGDNNFNSEADDGRDPFSLELDWGYDGEFILSERDAHAPQLISKEDSD